MKSREIHVFFPASQPNRQHLLQAAPLTVPNIWVTGFQRSVLISSGCNNASELEGKRDAE